jgi:hypothetical protein
LGSPATNRIGPELATLPSARDDARRDSDRRRTKPYRLDLVSNTASSNGIVELQYRRHR